MSGLSEIIVKTNTLGPMCEHQSVLILKSGLSEALTSLTLGTSLASWKFWDFIMTPLSELSQTLSCLGPMNLSHTIPGRPSALLSTRVSLTLRSHSSAAVNLRTYLSWSLSDKRIQMPWNPLRTLTGRWQAWVRASFLSGLSSIPTLSSLVLGALVELARFLTWCLSAPIPVLSF